MAYTQAQLDAIILTLHTRLASGTAEVEFEGRRVKYISADSILKAITYYQGLLATVAGTTPSRQIRMSTNSGY